jgi:hypothetical protein
MKKTPADGSLTLSEKIKDNEKAFLILMKKQFIIRINCKNDQ